jgi:hypothetical protein
MAEKSTRIADGATGNFIAMRDAFEPDSGSNARVIERVDFASGKFVSPIGNAARGNSNPITVIDSLDLTNLPADLTNNLLVVGDKSLLCVAVEQTVTGGGVIITPLLYDNAVTPCLVGLLIPKQFTQLYAFRRGAGSGNFVLNAQAWDVFGAHKIGLHITAITGTSNGIKVWGWVI